MKNFTVEVQTKDGIIRSYVVEAESVTGMCAFATNTIDFMVEKDVVASFSNVIAYWDNANKIKVLE